MKNFISNIKNEFLIYIFSLIFFTYSVFKFIHLEPTIDQSFHIAWFQYLKNSEHIISIEAFTNFQKFLIDDNGFINQLLRPANNPVDYHAYLFQINSVITVLISSYILNLPAIETYNVTSIFFSSISTIVNYKILISLLKEYKLYINKINNSIVYQLLFCFTNIVYYKFYFSPLGHHNIGYFIFSLTILYFLKGNYKNSKFFYYKLGLLTGFAIYFQITVALLLIPSFSLSILLKNFSVNKRNFQNFIKFISIILLFLLPFLFLIINDFLKSNLNFSNLLHGSGLSNSSFYIEKIFNWLNKTYILSTTIIFLGFIYSFFICFIKKKFSTLYLIIFVHFVINIILGIFYISYLRNFFYIFNIILILSTFSFIYIYQIKNMKYFIIAPLLLISIFYNLNIIFDKKNLISKENLMYQLYFENKGDVGNKIDAVNKIVSDKKIVFFKDNSKNRFLAYDFAFTMKKLLIEKPLLNLASHTNSSSNYSKYILNKNKILEKNFYLISLSEEKNKFIEQKRTFDKLKKNNLIEKSCIFIIPHKYKSFISKVGLTGKPIKKDGTDLKHSDEKNSIQIYLTEVDCN